MKILELHKGFLAVLVLAFMALGMLSACSSSEEEPPPADTGGSGCGDPDACPAGDVDCREQAMQDCNL